MFLPLNLFLSFLFFLLCTPTLFASPMWSEDNAEAKPKSSLPADIQSAQHRRQYPEADDLNSQGEDPQRAIMGPMQEGPHETESTENLLLDDEQSNSNADEERLPVFPGKDFDELAATVFYEDRNQFYAPPLPPSKTCLPLAATKTGTPLAAPSRRERSQSLSSSSKNTTPPKVSTYGLHVVSPNSPQKLAFASLITTTEALKDAQQLPLGSTEQTLALRKITPKVLLALDGIICACWERAATAADLDANNKHQNLAMRFEIYHALFFLARQMITANDDFAFEQARTSFFEYKAALNKTTSPSCSKKINESGSFYQLEGSALLAEQRKRKIEKLQFSEAPHLPCSSSSSRSSFTLSKKEAAQHDYLELLKSILDELNTTKNFATSIEEEP